MVQLDQTGDLRVDKIMPALCPAWGMMVFEECLQDEKGQFRKLKKKEISVTGRFPVIDQGERFISGYSDNEVDAYNGSLPVIIFGDHTRRIKFVDFPFVVGADGTKIFKPIESLIPKFFYYYLRCLNLESQGYSRHYRFLKQIKVPVPSIVEQRRIVAKLEKLLAKVDACKERLEKIPAILKRFRQSVLAAACSGRLTADWRKNNADVESASRLLNRIQENRKVSIQTGPVKKRQRHDQRAEKRETVDHMEFDGCNLPQIPPKWVWSTIQNLGELSRGRSKHRPRNDPKLFGGNYPFIQTGDVAGSTGRIKSHSQTYNELGLAQSRLFPANTLCITIAANIADTGILTYPACFPDSVVGFIAEEGFIEVLYAMYFIQTAQNDLKTFAPATAQKNINIEILSSLPIPVPPLDEQHEIVRRVEALFKIADDIEKRYKKARTHVDKLTQSILAKAFRGELVPQDPNDEPASELLKWIQEERRKQEAEGRPGRKSARRGVKN